MGVYLYTDEWLPWENTVAYYPLNSTTTVNDQSWNGKNLTNSWATFWTYSWVDCLSLSNTYLRGDVGDITQYSHTISMWANRSGGSWDVFMIEWWVGDYDHWGGAELVQRPSYIRYAFWFDDLDSPNSYGNGVWHNIVVEYNKTSSSQIMYIDGSLVNSRTLSNSHYLYKTNGFIIWTEQTSTTTISNSYFNGWMSNLIIENWLWNADYVANYYNTTKSKYWIS